MRNFAVFRGGDGTPQVLFPNQVSNVRWLKYPFHPPGTSSLPPNYRVNDLSLPTCFVGMMKMQEALNANFTRCVPGPK